MDISILQSNINDLICSYSKVIKVDSIFGSMVLCDFCPFCCNLTCLASDFERNKYNLCACAHLNRQFELKKN